MVLADSHEVSRAPCYSGNTTRGSHDFVYGTHTLYGTPLKMIRLSRRNSHDPAGRPGTDAPTTPPMQPLPGITHRRFSHFRFRSPLLTESLLFSLPAGTEMFHFPAFPPAPYVFRYRSSPSQTTGFPHSEILGSQPAYRLPEAYRRLPRPSSAPDAKASTVRP